MSISLGTPPQQVECQVDTASSDLWVNAVYSKICCSNPGPCEGGVFDPKKSTTFEHINSDFDIGYSDTTRATGDWVNDTLYFDGITLQGFPFGVSERGNATGSLIGIGFPDNEVQAEEENSPYDNFPAMLFKRGYIASYTYSIWLNEIGKTGSIVFGGYDRAKFEGNLVTMPIIKFKEKYIYFNVELEFIEFRGRRVNGTKRKGDPLPAILDSGSTQATLNEEMTKAVYAWLDATVQEEYGRIDCNARGIQETLNFGFPGITIRVPISELVLNPSTNEEGPCYFLIDPSPGDVVLGDSVLRSAYIVHDLARKEVSLAQAKWNVDASDIHEISPLRPLLEPQHLPPRGR